MAGRALIAGRFDRAPRAVALALLLLSLAACSSPNRGYWEGTFDGSVSGTVTFTINTRGTAARGEMRGRTADGQDFTADFEGSLRLDYLRAEFAGRSQTGLGLQARFEGLITGSLENGEAEGDWECELVGAGTRLSGTWEASQRSDRPA